MVGKGLGRARAPAPCVPAARAGYPSDMLTAARLVRSVTGLIALVIVLAILFRVLDANAGHDLVSAVHDLGRGLVGPFHGLFDLDDAKLQMAVNWGLAALTWSVAGGFVASALARAAPSGGPARAGR
jgi:hypothetical protein